MKKSARPAAKSAKAQKSARRAPAKAPAPATIALSNVRPDGKRMIEEARLERFPNRTRHRRYTIEFSTPEFTCICPMSGFPDFATLHITYVPRNWCVELKSLKLYFNQYRDRGIFHEDVANVILDELVALLDPWEMKIVADFNVRGNIKTVITATHERPAGKR